MQRLYLIVAKQERAKREAFLEERTAGTWRSRIELIDIYREPEHRAFNDGEVERVAASADALVFAPRAHTSGSLEATFPNVQRFASTEFDRRIIDWLRVNRVGWRANVEECQKLGAFRWARYSDWCEQFRKIDSARGLRVAAAILVQLRVATTNEMAAWFGDLPAVDHSTYFIGSDPHSGDHGLVNVLAARIAGDKLSEAHKLPDAIKESGRVRLFNDGGWSGGESERRLECLFANCEKKPNSLKSGTSVSMRFAYVTDIAETRISNAISELRARGVVSGSVDVSFPVGNRLVVGEGEKRGLAFQNEDVLRFVDPSDTAAMRRICKSIGLQLSARRPLGTAEIASTIAFEHSLPKAMLPVLIFGKEGVTAEDGSKFDWTPLLTSKHVSDPARDDQASFYCTDCAFVRKRPTPAALSAPNA